MNNEVSNRDGYLYITGTRGYSAYEVAVLNGYTGTEEEWLESLVGPQGPQGDEGKSAYEIAVENGFIGTEQEWVNSFLTPDGYIQKQDVVDNLESTQTQKPLSANQGRVLNETKEKIHNSLIFMPVSYYETNEASGDCTVLIANKSKKVVMFDTGATHSYNLIKEKLQENNITHIDYFILSHFHSDHFWNYSNLITDGYFDRNTVFYLPKLPNSENVTDISEGVDDFKNTINTIGSQIIYPNTTTELKVDDIEITFFNCNDEDIAYYDNKTTFYNNYSMCNYIKCGKTKILMTGDILVDAQEYLQKEGYISKCDVLKMPHHTWDLQSYDDFFISALPTFGVSSLNAWMFETTQARYNKALQVTNALGTKVFCLGNGVVYVGLGKETYCFYPNGIEMKPAEKDRGNSQITLYVDNTYTNSYCDGTKTNPFKTLKSAIAYARFLKVKLVVISFLTTYTTTEDISIDSSIPLIYLNSCSIGTINIYNSNAYLDGVTVTGAVNRALSVDGSKVTLKDVTINGDVSAQSDPYDGRGMTSYLSEINCENLTISNKQIAISLHNSSTMYITGLNGGNNNYGVLCSNSCFIGVSTFNMSCSSNIHPYSGGIVKGSITNDQNNVISNLSDGDDLNDYTNIGTYISQSGYVTTSLVNAPSDIGFAARLVVSKPIGLNNPLLQQEMISTNFEGSTSQTGRWIRTKLNDTSNWSAWRKVD